MSSNLFRFVSIEGVNTIHPRDLFFVGYNKANQEHTPYPILVLGIKDKTCYFQIETLNDAEKLASVINEIWANFEGSEIETIEDYL